MANSKTGLNFNIVAAMAAVYFLWGGTYLGMRFTVESLPPFLAAGSRFFTAGMLLYAWTRLRGVPRPERSQWQGAAMVGALLLLGGNGAVIWSVRLVPSGIAALIVATVPLWMVLINWLCDKVMPNSGVIFGLLLGLTGIVILMGPGSLLGGSEINPAGAIVLTLGAVFWAAGSLYSRNAKLPQSPIMATALEMITGGALLLIAGLASGECSRLDLAHVSLRSILALGYLVIFGSLIGFNAYIWLLKAADPALVSTYAYVNPVVAVFLGWLLADEPLDFRVALAAIVIVAAVVIITISHSKNKVSEQKAECGKVSACSEQAQ